jgi:hypothetical protein
VIHPNRRINEEGKRDEHEQDAGEPQRLGARGEERDQRRRYCEVIGIALLQAERTGRVAEPLEHMRRDDGGERDGKHDRADQHQLTGKLVA